LNLKRWSQLKKEKGSQRRLFWGMIGVILIVLILYLGVLPLVEAGKRMEEEILMKRKIIQKYDQFLRNRKAVEEELQQAQKQLEEIQKRLLPGETPQLGAAALQEIVKKVADKNGINIRSFKIVEPKDMTPYRKVSVQIDINPVNHMLSLGQFFFDIEHHEKMLMISEMNLLVFNIRVPNSIQGSLVLSGLMAGIKEKEKGKEDKI
jgi:Tfp pilus assembly protein PilO